MKTLKRAAVTATALAVAGTALTGGGSADAASAAPSSGASILASAQCLAPAVASARTTPEWHGRADVPVTKADLAAIPAADSRPSLARQAAEELPETVTVPVYVHVIKGTHRGELSPAGPARVKRAIAILNEGMAGQQSALSAASRYQFVLKAIDYTKRDSWYHAYFYGARDKAAKRALHRGDASTLNLYINGGGPRDEAILGWSRFPWQYSANPKLDGVSVNQAALLGGSATGYNKGDTVTHEVGHWMGLLHTFQGGCSESGDLVADTAQESKPSYYCETTRNTCTAPGLDPVRNFMDYSLDTCMNMFTTGQTSRMDVAFERYRF